MCKDEGAGEAALRIHEAHESAIECGWKFWHNHVFGGAEHPQAETRAGYRDFAKRVAGTMSLQLSSVYFFCFFLGFFPFLPFFPSVFFRLLCFFPFFLSVFSFCFLCFPFFPFLFFFFHFCCLLGFHFFFAFFPFSVVFRFLFVSFCFLLSLFVLHKETGETVRRSRDPFCETAVGTGLDQATQRIGQQKPPWGKGVWQRNPAEKTKNHDRSVRNLVA